MDKVKAIELLGGSIASAAREIGISYQAVKKWPPVLSARIADRVQAALLRSAGHKRLQNTGVRPRSRSQEEQTEA